MTQAITINIPDNAQYVVQVTEVHTLQDGTDAETKLVPMSPGSQNTVHIWEGKRVIIREIKLSEVQP